MLCPLLFTIVMEALCKSIELLYSDDLALVESPESLKGALEAWKGAISLQG